jgi:hypothetical protein
MCGADSAPHIHLLPAHRGSLPAGCLEESYSLRGRIWHHTLGGRNGVNPCASPETEQFLSQHGVDICLLIETLLNPGEDFRLVNYDCQRTDRLTAEGGKAILVRRGTVQHSVTDADLTHLEATAIQVILVVRTVKILVAYLSPSRTLNGADLTACFGGGLLLLLAGNPNAKHVDWNSRLNTRRGESYVIKPTKAPIWSLDRTPQTPNHTNPLLLPIS